MAPVVDISANWKMRLRPSLNQATKLPMRLTFGEGSESIVYDFIEFVPVRAGADEVELISTGEQPFLIRLVVQPSNPENCMIDLERRFEGANVVAVHKFLRAVAAIRPAGPISFYSLKHERLFMDGDAGTPALSEKDQGFEHLVKRSAEVATYFKVDLRLPHLVSETDLYALDFLCSIIAGSVSLKDVGATIIKDENTLVRVQPVLNGEPVQIRLSRSEQAPPVLLFGVPVKPGPLEITAMATLRDAGKVSQILSNASPGTAVEVWFELVGPGAIKASDMASRSPAIGV